MKLLAPSILSANFTDLKKQINIAEEAGADLLHLDVMDGHFVPNITFGPKMVNDINEITNMMLDVHLMISEPDKYVEQFAKAGADWISVHYETVIHLNRLIQKIKELGCKAGVALNPSSPVDLLTDILQEADFILLMSVNPGFGGQKFIRSTLKKTIQLKDKISNLGLTTLIEMDGGIGLDNMKSVSDAGTDVFVCGNSVFGSDDIGKTIRKMKSLLNE